MESRYSTTYEANLDPFSSFARAEKQRRYDALGPVDKATLAMVRNRKMRKHRPQLPWGFKIKNNKLFIPPVCWGVFQCAIYQFNVVLFANIFLQFNTVAGITLCQFHCVFVVNKIFQSKITAAINQSIKSKQSNNQSIEQSINQSINRTSNRSINQSINQSIYWSTACYV